MENMNTITTAIGTPVGAAACSVAERVYPVSGVASVVITAERAVAPKSTGHLRLDDDATDFAGTPAWSPPT